MGSSCLEVIGSDAWVRKEEEKKTSQPWMAWPNASFGDISANMANVVIYAIGCEWLRSIIWTTVTIHSVQISLEGFSLPGIEQYIGGNQLQQDYVWILLYGEQAHWQK